jgi:hypothetical protein
MLLLLLRRPLVVVKLLLRRLLLPGRWVSGAKALVRSWGHPMLSLWLLELDFIVVSKLI